MSKVFSIQVSHLFCSASRVIECKRENATSAANKDNLPRVCVLFHLVYLFISAGIRSPDPYVGIQVHSDHRLEGEIPLWSSHPSAPIHQSRSLHSAALAPLITIIISPHQGKRIDRPAFGRSTR